MSRYTKRKFQLGDYWLSQRSGSPAYYRTWLDKQNRRTHRASLGTSDYEQAKERLTAWFINHQRPEQAEPAEVSLASVLSAYYEHHGKHIRTEQRIRLAIRYWLDFFGDISVGDLASIPLQEGFHHWLRARGQVNTTINRNLSVGRAAINRSWKRGEIKSCPHIAMLEKGSADPKGRPLEPSEIRKLTEGATSTHLVDFIYWMLGTAARPEAITDMTWEQVDFENNLILLNPLGRKQNKKHRPTVKLPPALKERYWNNGDYPKTGPVISYRGKEVSTIRTAWRRTRAKVELDMQVNPYSLRHTAARWMRKEGVPAWDVSAQLGHKSREFSMTERYAPYSPDHMEKSVAALDKLLRQIDTNGSDEKPTSTANFDAEMGDYVI
ncbi:MAG: site-specific integrase [Robiginitomaculum sp.]|nr:site-specific integrase [Robiginitomaculum sp.]